MKITYYFISLLFLALTLTACSEEEVPVFSSDRGINFVLYDTLYQEYTDDYEELYYEHNYFKDYPDKGWNLPDVAFGVGVQLEGTFSEQPITVHIKAEPVDGYDMPEIEFPGSCVIEAGEYRANFKVVCKKPAELEKTYKATLTFDYEASGLVAGTKERQQYEITISDASEWDDMYVANETEWNSTYGDLLGDYGPIKGRLILVANGKDEDYGAGSWSGKSYTNIMYIYYYTKMGYSGGFSSWSVQNNLEYGLEAYEYYQGKPLTEADGTPVTFKFME